MLHYKALAIYSLYLAYVFIEGTTIGGDFNIFSILDKYGYPTAFLVVVLLILMNRQKKADADAKTQKEAADKERNDLIAQNNRLTVQLIDAVKAGNACKFEK